MALERPARIGEQNEAYRKGLVLGLTMAEVGILIIFVLLLLLAFGELGRLELAKQYEGKEAVESAELTQLRAGETTLQEIAKEFGIDAASSTEDFVHLAKVIRDAAQAADAKAALSEATRAMEEIKQARKEIQRIAEAAQRGSGPTIAKQVEQQAYRVANQEGQIQNLQNKLVAAGQGKGERPCWAEPDGTIDFLYDVVLTSVGIRMQEHVYPDRQQERALLPAPEVDPKETLSEAVFLSRTRALFEYSKQANCRFFVVVYDATASHEKPLYKSLLRTVEGHFYKRLDNGPSPF